MPQVYKAVGALVMVGLAMLAAGCSGKDSGIVLALEPDAVLLTAGSNQGAKYEKDAYSGSRGDYLIEFERRSLITISSGTGGQLLAAYRRAVMNVITNAGADIHVGGVSGDVATNVSDFSLSYSWRRTEGRIKLYSFLNEKGQMEIIFLCQEYH